MQQYYKHKIQNLLVISKIITIHYFEFEKSFRTEGESHDFWEIVYADKSDIICSADEREILLREGEMLFHKPNEFHTLSANGVNAPNVFIISFECKSPAISFFEEKKIRLDKNLRGYIYSIISESKKTFNLPYCDPGMKKLILQERPTLGGEQLIKNLLEIMLINIMRSMTETEEGNTTFIRQQEMGKKLIDDICQFLRENICCSLNMDKISEHICYSKAYIFKEFKKTMGKTIFEYYTELKIEYAKQLLREHTLTIREISEKLAFDTPNYFSKTFKKVTNFTPSLYQKLNHK